jgi:diadenosine tetraphosphate (Ap4A) HIT family hydrolase
MSEFTEIPEKDWLDSNEHSFAIYDNYPVTEGHILIITKQEVPTWFDANEDEQRAIMSLLGKMKLFLQEEYDPEGFNIGVNNGEAAGQTISHLHVHLIPRYDGDMDDPRGGVRHVIPERGNYKTADVEDWE